MYITDKLKLIGLYAVTNTVINIYLIEFLVAKSCFLSYLNNQLIK
jgi:hypothetical protein